MSTSAPPRPPRVVIVGAGMAGLAAARALRHAPVTVHLVDAHNFTTFPPLLFQVATCFISPEEVARPVRAVLPRNRRAEFRVGRVVEVDWAGKEVRLEDGGHLGFDFLVLATGVVPAYAGVAGAAAQAVPLKTVNDAVRLRNGVLGSFERAAARPDRAVPGDTRIAVVGGGPTGVELSGYVANFLFRYQFVDDYPQLDPASMRVTLLERGDRLLPGFHRKLSEYAIEALRFRGVEVRLRTEVVQVDKEGVVLSGGERVPASTVVWAGGVEAPGWITGLGLSVRDGRVLVDPDLRVPGRSDTFAVGDLAAVSGVGGRLYPQLAQVAIQTGRHAAHQIRRLSAGEPTTAFRYLDKGLMAVVGRNAAVVQTGPLQLTGRLAWIAWGFLHLGYLPGVINRMSTGLKYLWWHVSHESAYRALIEPDAPVPAGARVSQPRRSST